MSNEIGFIYFIRKIIETEEVKNDKKVRVKR